MKHTNSLQYEASRTTQVTNQLLQPPLIRHQRRKSNLCSDGTARIHLAKYKSRFQDVNPPKHQKFNINIISILKLIFIRVCPPGLQTKNIHVIILLVWSRDDWKAEALLAIIEHFVNCKNLSDPVISHTLDFVGMVAWIIKCEGHFFPVNGWQGMPGETSSSSPIGDTRSSRD